MPTSPVTIHHVYVNNELVKLVNGLSFDYKDATFNVYDKEGELIGKGLKLKVKSNVVGSHLLCLVDSNSNSVCLYENEKVIIVITCNNDDVDDDMVSQYSILSRW